MFIDDDTRKRLENIVKGIVLEGKEDTCTAARNLLCASFATSRAVKKDFESQSRVKKEQADFLRRHSTERNWWLQNLPDENSYLTRGGEAQVYFAADNKSVIKVNDGVYYATWLEFFNSIVIHNLLFEETAYTFQGFIEKEGSLLAVLRQPFIASDAPILILEDMHDENIIVNSNTLFFIDTVFYTVSE